jgi:GPH family glycoside/pentoside/hexuronide:cation symporter
MPQSRPVRSDPPAIPQKGPTPLPATPAKAPQETTPEILGFREKFSYGFGNLASCMYWQTFMLYLTIFYTDVFGIGAAAAGTMIGLSRSTDAFFDPIMGMLADRTRSRWGKFRPFLLWFCVPMAVMGVLTFTVPSLGSSGKLVWAYVTYNALMLIYTVINIPYIALLGVISPRPEDRTALSSIQFVGAFTGGIIVSATLLPMVRVGGWLGARTVERGWQLAFVLYGAAAILFFLTTFFNSRERVTPPKAQKTTVGRDLKDLFSNGPWLIVLGATITFVISGALRSSVTAYYFKYYVGPQTLTLPSFLPASAAGTQTWTWESLVSVFNTSNQVASLAGVIMIPFFAKITGRKAAVVVLMLIGIASTASFYFLLPNQLLFIYGLNVLGALTSGPLTALLWTFYADTADYTEWKRGRRATGLIFSASIFSQKQGWAIGAWLALALMQAWGFVANTAQTTMSQHGLVLLMSVLPAVFAVVALAFVVFYPLSEAKMVQIASDLKKRRSDDLAEATGKESSRYKDTDF